MLAPFMLVGLIAGMVSTGKIKEQNVKKIVSVLLVVSGAALILTNI